MYNNNNYINYIYKKSNFFYVIIFYQIYMSFFSIIAYSHDIFNNCFYVRIKMIIRFVESRKSVGVIPA